MKRVIYGFLGSVVLLIAAIVIAANSSFVIRKALDRFAPDYGISYRHISGNIFTGVAIEGISFCKKPMADEIVFSWNPSKLLYKRIAVTKIEMEGIDLDTVKSLIASFSESEETKSSESNTPFPLSVGVDRLHISIDPFTERNVSVTRTVLDAEGISYASDQIEVDALKGQIESELGNLDLFASMRHSRLHIRKCSLFRVDTQAIEKLFAASSSRSEVNATDGTVGKNEVQNREESVSLLPETIYVESFHADILPRRIDPLHLEALNLDVHNMHIDLESLTLKEGSVDFNATSNLTHISQKGKIVDNRFNGHIVLTPNKPLFDLYAPTIRKEAIGDIVVDVNATKERIGVRLLAHATHLLRVGTDANQTDGNITEPFNIDVETLKVIADYTVAEGVFDANAYAKVKTPFTPEATLDANFAMIDGKMDYNGSLQIPKVVLTDMPSLKFLDEFSIKFKGDDRRLRADIASERLSGYFDVPDLMKEGRFHLETIRPVILQEAVSLPEALKDAKLGAVIDMPVNLKKPLPLTLQAKISSDIANLRADLSYGDEVTAKIQGDIPENSLLYNVEKNVRWSAISPVRIDAKMTDKTIEGRLKAPKLSANMKMYPFKGTVEGKVSLAGMAATLQGDKSGRLKLVSDIRSFEDLFGTVKTFYRIGDLPKVEGALHLVTSLDKYGALHAELSSSQVRYHADRKTVHLIDGVTLSVGLKKDTLQVDAYQLTYNDMHFFATRPSTISFGEKEISVDAFWLNDQLLVSGAIDPKRMQGHFNAKSDRFTFSHEMIDLTSKIDLEAKLDGNSTDVTGTITLLEGNIHYDLSTKTFPSDSDIVIVQEMKKKGESPFMDHLTMQIRVVTDRPMVYKQGPVDIEANVDLGIHKSVFSDMMVLGSIDIVDGSSYTFEGKRFVLKRSHIYMTGDPSKPMLDITVKYQALRHLISINVSGTPAVPNILFSSVPSLSKEQILSIILFDSEEGADTNDANDMMKMMGGAMAKSALNDLGVQIDHLVIGEGNSVEVGKKISDKVTVIYINAEVPKMEVKYKYSPAIEVVVGASEESESIDVNYIKDFNFGEDEDIVIKR